MYEHSKKEGTIKSGKNSSFSVRLKFLNWYWASLTEKSNVIPIKKLYEASWRRPRIRHHRVSSLGETPVSNASSLESVARRSEPGTSHLLLNSDSGIVLKILTVPKLFIQF